MSRAASSGFRLERKNCSMVFGSFFDFAGCYMYEPGKRKDGPKTPEIFT